MAMMGLYYCKVGEGDWKPWAAWTRSSAATEHAVSCWAEMDAVTPLRVLVCDRVRLSGPTPTWIYDVAVTATEVMP